MAILSTVEKCRAPAFFCETIVEFFRSERVGGGDLLLKVRACARV